MKSSFNKTTDLYSFSVYLISINNWIPIQTLVSSSSLNQFGQWLGVCLPNKWFWVRVTVAVTKIPMPIISIPVLILFQRSILQACFDFFPIFPNYRCFLHSFLLAIFVNKESSTEEIFSSCLALQQSG